MSDYWNKYWVTDIWTGEPRPMHPGEVLELDFVKADPLRPVLLNSELFELAHCQRDVTPDVAEQLAKMFGTTALFWLNLQSHYDQQRF